MPCMSPKSIDPSVLLQCRSILLFAFAEGSDTAACPGAPPLAYSQLWIASLNREACVISKHNARALSTGRRHQVLNSNAGSSAGPHRVSQVPHGLRSMQRGSGICKEEAAHLAEVWQQLLGDAVQLLLAGHLVRQARQQPRRKPQILQVQAEALQAMAPCLRTAH